MSESKHTPGPWYIPMPSMGFSEIRSANGDLVFGIAAGDTHEKQPDDICDANARLIAAAPDMLEALQYIVNNQWCFDMNVLKAAIAKATEEQA